MQFQVVNILDVRRQMPDEALARLLDTFACEKNRGIEHFLKLPFRFQRLPVLRHYLFGNQYLGRIGRLFHLGSQANLFCPAKSNGQMTSKSQAVLHSPAEGRSIGR